MKLKFMNFNSKFGHYGEVKYENWNSGEWVCWKGNSIGFQVRRARSIH